jgi:gluconate 2-dehydrogenase gamma chain
MSERRTTPEDAGAPVEFVSRAAVSRRRFLQSIGVAGIGIAATQLPGCSTAKTPSSAEHVNPSDIDAENLGYLPPGPPSSIRSFFSRDEAATVEAVAARIIPGTPADPGAVEAGVVTYIDVKLAEFAGFAEPTYTEPPFMKTYTGGQPPAKPGTVYVASQDADRYGSQGQDSPQNAYRKGIAELDTYTSTKFGKRFVDLSGGQQDTVLSEMEAGNLDDELQDPPAKSLFKMMRTDVIEGMFADPVYLGNANFAGWNLIKYPGAQRGYLPLELKKGPLGMRKPQGLKELAPTHPGLKTGPGVKVPTQEPQPGVR